MRYYLKLFLEREKLLQIKEDIHYSFCEYQRANLIHFTTDEDKIDIEFLSGSSLFILDGDVAEKTNWTDKLTEKKIDFFILKDVKEIESLIPDRTLRQYLKEFESSKAKNDDIDKLVNYGQFLSTKAEDGKYHGLGSYLRKVLPENKEKLSIVPKTGKTIAGSKKLFAARIVKLYKESNDYTLTKKQEELCQVIVDFIKNKNGIS